MQPQGLPQPSYNSGLPGHGMEPSIPGQPTDMPPTEEMPDKPAYPPILPDKNPTSPGMPGQSPDNPNSNPGVNPYEKRDFAIPAYDNQDNNSGQLTATEAPSPATAPAAAPPPPPPGGPNGPSDNNYLNDPNLSNYADNLNTANKDMGTIRDKVIQPPEVLNKNNIAPDDMKNIEDINRRKEAFKRYLEDFKNNLPPDELEIYKEVFG